MKVWLLTTEYNDYDQYGEYFLACFAEKPHHTQLTNLGIPTNLLRHVLNGGGRKQWEDCWYWLKEIECIPAIKGGKN